ncbi:hypothetical protein NQ314_005214 [Rhamnusium bicolor]|uniref:DDE Tnp4 domain-containing protein n=1 Tax=Rhamnusium bicolor TaxID=1586634 RepID=A0AAV8ZHK3_9CUCU|nr:hypothetical protein NQ314_005214 [Rhamnusium bicolor]
MERLSRACRVFENIFGILSARWRIFLRHLQVQPEIADNIITSACCLHNMLCANNDFEPANKDLNSCEGGLTNLAGLRQNYTQYASNVRDKYRDYFVSDVGSVPWQLERVRRGRQNI